VAQPNLLGNCSQIPKSLVFGCFISYRASLPFTERK
jgi:hypothetical protein